MSWKLWLDDDAGKDFIDPFRNPPDDTWKVAISSNTAIELINQFGVPFYISFDHDLGNDDNAIVVVNFLIENYYDAEIDFDIHSRNIEGGKNIKAKMNSWKKSKSL